MKFAKVLQSNADQMPEEWRPYLIHYKALKKRINAIVQELEDRGLPSPIIKTLLDQSMDGQVQRLEYSFDEDDKNKQHHLKTCLRVVLNDDLASYGPLLPKQEEQLSQLLQANEVAFLKSASSSTSDLHERMHLFDSEEQSEVSSVGTIDITPPMSPSPPQDSSEFESATKSISSPNTTAVAPLTPLRPSPLSQPPLHFMGLVGDESQDEASTDRHQLPGQDLPTKKQHRQQQCQDSVERHPPTLSVNDSGNHVDTNAAAAYSDTINTINIDGSSDFEPTQVIDLTAKKPHHAQSNRHNSRVITTEEEGRRVLVIELTADTAFFDQLGEEVSQLSKLQEANKKEFEAKVEDLSRVLTVVSSPSNKDMYTWREILKIYLDAQVFVGESEQDRATRSSEKAQKQLQWFLKEIERTKLVAKFKQSKSKIAFNTFFELNSDLITMKQFKELNQMAMTKILKKHDKRTSLTASSGFPKHLQNEPFYNDNISKSLTFTIGCQLLSIIPQPDDYLCPICMSVAWKPIRLNCNHIFCVRCLIKAQRKKMVNCPICRHESSVAIADARNLDVPLMNFMKMYFPKEIKEKRKEASREQAAEDYEVLTGTRYQEETCTIM